MTLILADHSKNDLTRGDELALFGIAIEYYGKATLTIGGTGTLVASAGNYAAGIGGVEWRNDIVINGGVITATGGRDAPGIGANFTRECGSITFNGGTTVANGGDNCYGIGAGYESSCGNISFNNGASGCRVTANGGVSPGLGKWEILIDGVPSYPDYTPFIYPVPTP